MDIEWQEGAVCFANEKQWFSAGESEFGDLVSEHESYLNFNEVLEPFDNDFQLNTIKQGDYIEASELDTEQKYNDVVEALWLFGFENHLTYGDLNLFDCLFVNLKGEISGCYKENETLKRELAYQQIIAIVELKRLIGNHDNSAPKTATDLAPDIDTKTAKDYLNECIEVQNQRGEQYDSKGTGERSFAAAASAFNAMTGSNLKGSDVCLLLACVKAVRQYSDPSRVHEDSLLDLVSYASLWAEELNKEVK
jgi:hypothetical protein